MAKKIITKSDVGKLCGWIPAPEVTEKWLSSDPMRAKADAKTALKPLRSKWKDNPNVRLWEYEKKVCGRLLSVGSQGIGDCVSWGWAHGCTHLIVVRIAKGLGGQWIAPVATEPIYGGS